MRKERVLLISCLCMQGTCKIHDIRLRDVEDPDVSLSKLCTIGPASWGLKLTRLVLITTPPPSVPVLKSLHQQASSSQIQYLSKSTEVNYETAMLSNSIDT